MARGQQKPVRQDAPTPAADERPDSPRNPKAARHTLLYRTRRGRHRLLVSSRTLEGGPVGSPSRLRDPRPAIRRKHPEPGGNHWTRFGLPVDAVAVKGARHPADDRVMQRRSPCHHCAHKAQPARAMYESSKSMAVRLHADGPLARPDRHRLRRPRRCTSPIHADHASRAPARDTIPPEVGPEAVVDPGIDRRMTSLPDPGQSDGEDVVSTAHSGARGRRT
jgi:hypothetical protein